MNANSFPSPSFDIPYLSTDQMIEVDRAMMEDFQIDLVRMMENAGRSLAIMARERFLDGSCRSKRVVVLAGTGGNGGGALVAARRLACWGAQVDVYLSKPAADLTSVPAQQLTALRNMEVAISETPPDSSIPGGDVILDGVIGYSLKGAPRGQAKVLIEWANASGTPTLSLDAPSGVDTTTGTVFDPAIQATATVTIALPKEGLRAPNVAAAVGELYLADISVPPSLYSRPPLNLKVAPLFEQSDILRIR